VKRGGREVERERRIHVGTSHFKTANSLNFLLLKKEEYTQEEKMRR
jgi:hypothetical protein